MASGIDGIISGLDTTKIIQGILKYDQAKIDQLKQEQAEKTNMLATWQSINALLLGVKTTATTLHADATWQARSVTSSNEDVVTATASAEAAPGTYQLTVSALAQNHQIASQGFADVNQTSIGTGTLDIRLGNGSTKTITIDDSHDTLQGLADAINNADAGVTASIINDGSSLNPYRLIIQANDTGLENEIHITNNLSGGERTPDFTNTQIDDVETDPNNAATYTGEATSSGTYTGSSNSRYVIEIMNDGAVGTATFKFSTDGGVTWNDNGGAGYATSTTGTTFDQGVAIAFSDSGTLSQGDRFYIDTFVPTIQAPADAQITLGDATGGGAPLTVTSSSNTVSDLVPGVTLNLVSADPDSPVTITVTNDTSGVETAIRGFVDAYNKAMNAINDQFKYDPDTGEGGVLMGDTTLMNVQSTLRDLVVETVPGLPSSMNSLSAIGITLTDTGTLAIDSAKLSQALSENYADVERLFKDSGISDNSGIQFVLATDDTRVSPAGGYQVDITQAAEQAKVVASGGIGTLTIDDTNDTLQLNVNGNSSGTITLTHKTYTSGTELAAEIQTRINEAISGQVVTVQYRSGRLEIATSGYGSDMTLALEGGNAFANLGFTGSESAVGKDVAGTIAGEAATGHGQILTGSEDNTLTAGLQLLVTLTPAQIAEGAEGSITFTRGFGTVVDNSLEYLTDPTSGTITYAENALNNQIDDLAEQIKDQQALMDEKSAMLYQEFNELESTLQSLKTQGDYLSAQLASLPKNWKSNNE